MYVRECVCEIDKRIYNCFLYNFTLMTITLRDERLPQAVRAKINQYKVWGGVEGEKLAAPSWVPPGILDTDTEFAT